MALTGESTLIGVVRNLSIVIAGALYSPLLSANTVQVGGQPPQGQPKSLTWGSAPVWVGKGCHFEMKPNGAVHIWCEPRKAQ